MPLLALLMGICVLQVTFSEDNLKVDHPIPSSWDWRQANAVPSVKDMGVCNAGWAFASVALY